MKFEWPWTKIRRANAALAREQARGRAAIQNQIRIVQHADELNDKYGKRAYMDHVMDLQFCQLAIYVKNRSAMQTLYLPPPDPAA